MDTEDDGNKVLPLSGYAITCVLCFFSFKYAGEDFSMALMWWYTLCDDTGDRDKATSMWLVKLEYKDGELHLAVVPVACYVQVEHSARLELMGCDQDILLVGDRASASSTLSEHWDYGSMGDTW